MLRFVLSAVVLGMTAMPVSTDVSCVNSYFHFWERASHRADAMSGDRLAALHRGAIRIFDACDSGGISNAEAMFEKLENDLEKS